MSDEIKIQAIAEYNGLVIHVDDEIVFQRHEIKPLDLGEMIRSLEGLQALLDGKKD